MPNWEHATGEVVKVGQADIDRMIELAWRDPQHKYRYCAHLHSIDAIHQMVIVHLYDTIVPIHKHKGKIESFHWIKGYADVLLYHDDGAVRGIVPMGPYGAPGRICFYRLNADIYHTLKILSPVIVFQEVTTGPWHKEDLILAPFWKAPEGWSR